MDLKDSCPAVSQIYSLNTYCSSLIIKEPNSTPTVTSWSMMNSLVVTRCIKQLLPTAESPIMISLKSD